MLHDMHGLWAVPAVSMTVISMLLSSSNDLSLPTLATMPQGVTIPNMMRETIVRMSADFRPEKICTYTDVSERQQSQILKLWRDTGTPIPAPDRAFWRGHPRNLSAEEVFVSAPYIPCREPQRLMSLAWGPSSDHVVPSQFCWPHLQHIPGWAPGSLGGYLWYSSTIIYNLAHIEACWILYEEGMLALLSILSPFSSSNCYKAISTCAWAQCHKACWLSCQDCNRILVIPACFCRRKLLWSPNDILQLCLGNWRAESSSKGFFHKGTKVYVTSWSHT